MSRPCRSMGGGRAVRRPCPRSRPRVHGRRRRGVGGRLPPPRRPPPGDRARRSPRPHAGTHRSRVSPRRPIRSPRAARRPDTRYHTMRAALAGATTSSTRPNGSCSAARRVPRPLRVGGRRGCRQRTPRPRGHHVGVAGRQVDGRRRRRRASTVQSPRAVAPVRRRTAARDGHAAATASRHAAYYADLAARLAVELRGRSEIETALRLDDARDNFRAAFDTALGNADAAVALAIPVHLTRYAATHMWVNHGLGPHCPWSARRFQPSAPARRVARRRAEPGSTNSTPRRSRSLRMSSPSSSRAAAVARGPPPDGRSARLAGPTPRGRHCRNGRCLCQMAEITDATLTRPAPSP